MAYREKRIYSGDILEIEIYPISKSERKQKRKQKEKESLKKQKNLNDKNAKKHLTRLLNTNFTDKDLSITLTYDIEHLPSTEEEARKDVKNYLRRLKNYRRKNGLEELKYIAVIEYKEQLDDKKAIRLHHHIVTNGGVDRDIAETLWKKGRINADRLKADNFGYEGLARYITKDPKGNKRWTQSRNLKQPTIKVNDYKYSGRKVYEIAREGENGRFEASHKGYSINDYKVEVNAITAYIHLYIKMKKTNNRKVSNMKMVS